MTILNSIKQMLGITEDYDAFDYQILVAINASFGVLFEVGFDNFTATDETTWDEYNVDPDYLGMVQQFVYQKTKQMFDPPQNGAVKEAMQQTIDEMIWRLNAVIDLPVPYKQIRENADG